MAAADEAYNYLISNFYVEPLHAFKTEFNNETATYTPFNFAVIAGALREAALVGGHTEAATIYTRFFKKVANKMQLAEFETTGETGNDSDGDGIPYLLEQPDQLAPVFATEAQLDLQITGINDAFAIVDADLVLYPNPTTNSTTISVNIKKEAVVKIEAIGVTGKKIQTIINLRLPIGQTNTTWDVSNLSSGIYYIRTTVGSSNVVTKKLIIY